ncbi:MAG: hypothetical protein FWH40_02980 [Coriobacteriia bacterium]|nr:hypothetical protein [Coriobacteriia bacterium]
MSDEQYSDDLDRVDIDEPAQSLEGCGESLPGTVDSRVKVAEEAAQEARSRKISNRLASLPVSSQASSAQSPTATKARPGLSANARSQRANLASSRNNESRSTASSQALVGNLRQTGMHDTSYRVRGGGFTQGKGSLYKMVITCIVAIALVAGGIGTWQIIGMVTQVDVSKAITVSVDQSHQALDSSPRLLNYLELSADEAYDRLRETDLPVYMLDRNITDNPDQTANGKEVIYFTNDAIEDDFAAYTTSEFSSFDFDTLQDRLLGSWVMALSNGELGRFAQLKYVNMATTGLYPEMYWMLNRQGLADERSMVVYEGDDRYGNSMICGYASLDEDRIVYWQAISCPFSARYRGSDNRPIPDTSAYVKIRIATWDFYGVSSYTIEG